MLRTRSNRGWTLVELVMVIVIIGILAAVAVPKYFSLASEARLASDDGVLGACRSAAMIAFLKHRVSGDTASGSTAGDDQWITNAAALAAYLEGGLPDYASTSGSTITLHDKRTITVTTAEDEESAAVITGSW